VYLVQDTSSGALYALKKIRCPFGQESVQLAIKEVEAYALFKSRNIITCIDHSISSDRSDPSAKTVYILLPYYRRGNLQDAINANLVNHTKFPERKLLQLFLGVCRALETMHGYTVPEGSSGARNKGKQRAERIRAEAERADDDAEDAARRQGAEDPEAESQRPLMRGADVTRALEGAALGQTRAYAHRDIKPGRLYLVSLGSRES
jgi:serine/threonine kinase 16